MSLLHADVAVVGSELCGWLAGALLAQQGLRVVVIDDEESVDVRPLGDRLVPIAPTLWRLPQTGAAAGVIDELGIRQRARLEFGPPSELALIDDPDLRMVLPLDPDARRAELGRAFGDDADALEKAIASFRPEARDCLLEEASLLHESGILSQFRSKRRRVAYGAAGFIERDDEDILALARTPLAPALPFLAPFVQGLAGPSARGMSMWLSAWQLLGGTLASTRSGLGLRGALRQMLSDVVHTHGGQVMERLSVAKVEAEGKRVQVIRTEGNNDYAVRMLVDATRRRGLSARLPDDPRRAQYRRAEGSVALVQGAAIVRWLLPGAVLPRGLSSRSLLLPMQSGDPPVLVGVFEGPPGLERKQETDAGMVAAVAIAPCAIDESERIADHVASRLQAFLPFAEGALLAEDRMTGQEAADVRPGFAAAAEPNLLGGRPLATPYANVVRAGRDLTPALGIEGEFAAARAISQLCARALGVSKRT